MKKSICFVVASPMTAKSFLRDHFRVLSETYDITLIANFEDAPALRSEFHNIKIVHAPISRQINIFSDLKALFEIYRILDKGRFSAIHSVTPKAGLLAMLAARMSGVPQRFHTFTGQVWATKSGPFRWLLKSLDKITYHCTNHVLVDSPTQRQFLIEQGVIDEHKSSVLADGSICGVDAKRFQPSSEYYASVRTEFGLNQEAFIFLFLGRLNREKGLAELVTAFQQSGCANRNAVLMLVGPEEDTVLADVGELIVELGNAFVRLGHTNQPEKYMAAANVFCLPSHREGFGSVIIEAAACGVPSLASDIYGVSDAVENGITGLLHPVRDVAAIAQGMVELMNNHTALQQMSVSGIERAKTRFSAEVVVSAMVKFYRDRVG